MSKLNEYQEMQIMNAFMRMQKRKNKEGIKPYTFTDFITDIDNFVDEMD